MVFEIIEQLAQGYQFLIGDRRIGMGVDLSIGYVMHNQETEEEIIMGDMTIRQLAELIEKEGIQTV